MASKCGHTPVAVSDHLMRVTAQAMMYLERGESVILVGPKNSGKCRVHARVMCNVDHVYVRAEPRYTDVVTGPMPYDRLDNIGTAACPVYTSKGYPIDGAPMFITAHDLLHVPKLYRDIAHVIRLRALND